jgi:ribosome biogenesis GTPase
MASESTGQPDIAIAVILENEGEGSDFAAPVFQRIVETYYLGSPQSKLWFEESIMGPTLTPTPIGGVPTESRSHRLATENSEVRERQKNLWLLCTHGKDFVSQNFQHGLIIKAQSGFFTVETGQGFVVCQLRGKLKQGRARGDIAAIGDKVQITVLADGSGAIEEVEPRARAIVRLDPRPQGDYQQVLLANADQAVFVFACAHPDPRLKMLDRFLVIAEKQEIPAVIVANKIDLIDDPKEIFGLYETIGYHVLYSSTKPAWIEELKLILAGKIRHLPTEVQANPVC